MRIDIMVFAAAALDRPQQLLPHLPPRIAGSIGQPIAVRPPAAPACHAQEHQPAAAFDLLRDRLGYGRAEEPHAGIGQDDVGLGLQHAEGLARKVPGQRFGMLLAGAVLVGQVDVPHDRVDVAARPPPYRSCIPWD